MPLQSRVDPWGRLVAVTERGHWLGNRGCLVDDQRNIVRPWRLKAWITCELEYKGKKRRVFSPGTWTELFFLDEAAAFAAGHRPCAFCRRSRYTEFKSAWLTANAGRVPSNPPIVEIDHVLHAERIGPGGAKKTFQMIYGDVPVGTFIELHGAAHVVSASGLARWSFRGYEPAEAPASHQNVSVLTPLSVVRMFSAGFRPQLHQSAGRGK